MKTNEPLNEVRTATARSGRIMLATALAIALASSASLAKERVQIDLSASANGQRARGKATLSLRQSSQGRFDVRAQRLESATEYEVIVGDVKVATVQSNRRGRMCARFSTAPRGDDRLLGFDPRGASISIRKAGDDDVLGGDLPDDSGNDTDVTCCLPDHGGDGAAECEDRTAEECAAAGGTVSTATSCLPNPCGATPPQGKDIVCCVPDDSGAQCEDRTQAECLAEGGTVVEATSCDPNPCAATPPQETGNQCCIPVYYGTPVCEDRTPEDCAAVGGIDAGPGTCAPDACAGVVPPDHGGSPTAVVTCERRAGRRSKISVNGKSVVAGTYTARVTSGANTAESGEQTAVNAEVEFDFDSDSGDIAAGATPIDADFIQGSPPQVSADILNSTGAVVASGTATCRDR